MDIGNEPARETGDSLLPTESGAQSHGEDVQVEADRVPCGERFTKFLHSVALSVYVSHFLSAWGDRMWAFAVGLYLNDLSPENLRLVASYGFALGATVLFMGAVIGDLVDKYPRLQVARTALIGQNLCVAICATLVCLVYYYKSLIYSSETWVSGLCEAGIIVLAIIAYLFSTAYKIAVQKDWIGVICEGNSTKLARMNSQLRAIDLITSLVAPIVTGLIMTIGSMFLSAISVAGWNLVSVVCEYLLIHRVYCMVPALAIKKAPSEQVEENADELELYPATCELKRAESVILSQDEALGSDEEKDVDPVEPSVDIVDIVDPSSKLNPANGPEVGKKKKKTSLCRRIFSSFITLYEGWRTYMNYETRFAGLGLACLYMTVLGFDNITIGYAYNQGASMALNGGLMAAGALVGVTATIAYPRIRKKIGIEKTGHVGLWCEIVCLTFCLASIWLPGSPFDLTKTLPDQDLPEPATGEASNSTVTFILNTTMNMTTTDPSVAGLEPVRSALSLSFLMAGIIAARFGLWTADLTVSQLLVERVKPDQRGVVNGVQGSLNMFMDMLKFVMVIVAPHPQQFGILVLISFAFICLGAVSYIIFTREAKSSRSRNNENLR